MQVQGGMVLNSSLDVINSLEGNISAFRVKMLLQLSSWEIVGLTLSKDSEKGGRLQDNTSVYIYVSD